MDWHSKTAEEALKEQYSSIEGLKEANASERLIKFGPNELQAKEKTSPFIIFLRQFNSPMIWILMAAAAISFAVSHFDPHEESIDGIVILVILVFNAGFGFFQEFKAEKSIEALRKLTALKAKVIRDGKEAHIDAADLVPGDIIMLETGDKVPADARLIEAVRLETDESSLTGESTTVKKAIDAVALNAPIAERFCMVYSSTTVAGGRGKALVVDTGMRTEIGKIADMVQQAKPKETPLQHKLAQLGEFLAIGTLIVCAIVFLVSILRLDEYTLQTLMGPFMIAISLAVAAIPEGLPAVVTISLALGVQRMVKKNALVRVLPAVETLGSCNVICTDKTGTLTYNQMTVREIYANDKDITVSGHGYEPQGIFEHNDKKADTRNLGQLIEIAALCNDAEVKQENEKWEVFGDPTEAALIVTAKKAGIDTDSLKAQMPRIDELPFDSTRKLMTTIHNKGRKRLAYVKGAPDVIIEKCSHILVDGKKKKLTAAQKKKILDKNFEMANKALRVLGFGYREVSKTEKNIESRLVFAGLMGMIDPPRQEVIQAISRCKEAGIKVVMITGDHKATAVAIGRELGLQIGDVLTGSEIDEKQNLTDIVDRVTIYARVSPQHKMRIINALKSKEYVVAMTGDGVNDAPALKRSDIGVAMGITGTDVAKEASDMILTDDNFASIVNAVEEGRGIYDNIKKFVKYLLSSNLAEILTIFVAIMIGFHDPENAAKVILPLIPVQLLWINLLTDGPPALALGVEPTDPDSMKQPPRKSNEKIVSLKYGLNMAIVAIIMAAGTLFIFNESLKHPPEGVHASIYAGSMAFLTLVLFQLFNVLNSKSDTKSALPLIFNNKWLLLAIGFSLSLQFLVLYTPLSGVFQTTALSLKDWGVALLISSTVLIFEEIRKFMRRHHVRA